MSFVLNVLSCSCLIVLFLFTPVRAETVQDEFQKAVLEKRCFDVKRLLKRLISDDSFYFNVLGTYYEQGFCFEQDDAKAFHAYSQAPTDISTSSLFKRSLMYFEGRGVEKNEPKSIEIFHIALKQEIQKSYNFKHIREMLQLILNRSDLPDYMDVELTRFERIEEQPSQKVNFILELIEKNESPEDLQAAINLLENLAHQKNDPEAAYQLALIKYSQNKPKEGFLNLVTAANKDHSMAQSQLGQLYFEGKKPSLSKSSSYAMLLRAYHSGSFPEKEIEKYKSKLLSHELDAAEKEAAMPLPE